MLLVWTFFCFIFMIIYVKSYMTIMMILNIEYYSIVLVFTMMMNLNYSTNGIILSIILLMIFSMESILLLTFYVNMTRALSKDYNFFSKMK